MKPLDERPTVIILCPIRNEEDMLHRFLSVTSFFADHIILADQRSTDRSKEIAREFSKVILLDNPHEYNEGSRQQLLIEEARKIPGRRLLLALDVDEILSANVLDSREWQTMLSLPAGTVIGASRIELWKTPLYYRPLSNVTSSDWMVFGFMDDGSSHSGLLIHSLRVPQPLGCPFFRFNQVVILHYNSTDYQRTLSKNRWYLCFERIRIPNRNPTQLHRLYSEYISENMPFPPEPCPTEWFAGWIDQGIDMTSIQHKKYYWWDWEVLRMLGKYGTQTFRHEDIWYVDWEAIRQAGLDMGIPNLPQQPIKDPRTRLERHLIALRRRTQNTKWQRLTDRVLRLARK